MGNRRINMTLILPIMMICLAAGSAVAYACQGDWKRAVYWAAAAVLTGAVTI